MKAILFDRGDTLIQFGEPDYDAGRRELLASVRPANALDLATLARFEDEFFAKIDAYRKQSNLDCNLLHYYELLARYFCIRFDMPYQELCHRYHFTAENISPMDGAQHVLAELKRAGFLLGLVTNTPLPHSVVVEEFKRLSLYEYFDTVVCSSEIVFRKPDAAMFEVALRELQVAPDEAIFVGDNYHADVVGAKNVGMTTVWLNPNRKPIPGEVKPDYIIAGLEEILALPEIAESVKRGAKSEKRSTLFASRSMEASNGYFPHLSSLLPRSRAHWHGPRAGEISRSRSRPRIGAAWPSGQCHHNSPGRRRA
jgi:putative hydrolase of the HAD superfamily